MQQNVSDFIVKRLSAWGVKRLFGYPGDGINGLLGALNRAGGEPAFVQTRHEEMAAFMASAHAKFTGEVGVCLATSGPGAIHLLNGLYDARTDHQPVVAIVGQKARTGLGGHNQQEVDLVSLFKDVAGEYVQMATVPAQIRHLIDRAFRIALSQRTVTCVIIPNDLQTLDYEEPPREHDTIHSGAGYTAPRILPRDEELQRAADVLNAGQKVAMLIGSGAQGAVHEVIEVAERLGAGVAKAFLGKAVLPDDLPFVTGAIGLFGTNASHRMMQECDTLLMVGSSFPYAEFLPKEGQARGVQIDVDGRMLSIRYPMEVNLVGDSAETLRALLPLLQPKEDRSFRQMIEQEIRQWHGLLHERALEAGEPVNPRLVFAELSPRLPDACILTADSGSSSSWVAQYIQIRPGMRFSVSGSLASMGCAVPYAIAAKFAHADRVVIACAGDGAMQMNGLSELLTIQKYWRQWANPQLIVLVLNNRDLNFVTWEQRLMLGDPRYVASQQLPELNYAAFAESLGLEGIRVERPEDVAGAWERALAADRPVVLDVLTDPEVIAFTPEVAMKYAQQLAGAIRQGDKAAEEHLEEPLRTAVLESEPS
ncbi:pyruvate dehydrogenase (cytochrome) [Fibrisoma limi BUZ 3]|uniref:Pyruvate dehydrogenase (Cytochrome) n=1 Tax=Fibrisoma limi BUZ 3 TaxID=1185876 RepID=I2GJ81_9BACT|nr:thiamine pyrophosphate-requiring protein [Fibrisoma limi]CCH53956.1 pyruvate dehydrogenase (cytochrome) [Fibrisoma limi BUZ 3]